MPSARETVLSVESHGPPQRRAGHNPAEAVPRLKRWAPKVKTGCSTCRYRRIKCDETKPACTRCTSSRRKCGGYEIDTPPSQASPDACIVEQPTCSSAPHGLDPTARERQIFHLLRTLTVHQIDGGIKQEFWKNNFLQATYTYPALWHAALAFSAIHLRASMLSDEAQAYFAEEYQTFALKHYTTSIGYIISIKSHDKLSGADQEMLLTASLLYTGICLMRADLKQARTHARNAMKLSCQWDFANEEEKTAPSDGVLGRKQTMQLIKDVYYSFGSLGDIFSEDVAVHFLSTIPYETEPFTSFDEAYYAYMPIHTGQLKIKGWQPETRRDEEVSPPTNDMLAKRHALNLWNIRFEGYLQSPKHSPEDLQGIARLQLFRLFEKTFQDVMINRTPEMWAKQEYKWERIMKMAEHLIRTQYEPTEPGTGAAATFTYSASVYEILRLTGFICRNGTIRRRVINLLKQKQHRDGVWDTEFGWLMVETKMFIEEQALAAANPGSCECVPDLFFCTDHRVSMVTVDFPVEGIVTMNMKTGADCLKDLPGVSKEFKLRR